MIDIIDWVMDDMEPTRKCMNSNEEFPIPALGGPVGVSETFRRTGVNTQATYVWKLWFENREARDAFHAQLPPDHPIITGDIGASFGGMTHSPVPPTTYERTHRTPEPPDISRIRLEDLGGRQ